MFIWRFQRRENHLGADFYVFRRVQEAFGNYWDSGERFAIPVADFWGRDV